MAISRRTRADRTSMNDSVASPGNFLPPETAAATTTTATRETNSSMIAVRALAKKIGQQEILRGVDLDVAVGETLAIIGRSGGGKTVLLKHLVGWLHPEGAAFGFGAK